MQFEPPSFAPAPRHSPALAHTAARYRANRAVKLRVGTGRSKRRADLLRRDMGFFKKNGLDVEVVKLRSGTTTWRIIAGDLQCGVANVLSLGAAHQRNVPLVMIGPAPSTTATRRRR